MAVSAKDKQTLGKKLKMARETLKLSQRQAARDLEISNAALSDIENGNNFPSETLLLKMVDKYQPRSDLRNKIFILYAKAKDAPPPDISSFIKNNTPILEVIRAMMRKNITPESINTMLVEISKMEDRQDEPTN